MSPSKPSDTAPDSPEDDATAVVVASAADSEASFPDTPENTLFDDDAVQDATTEPDDASSDDASSDDASTVDHAADSVTEPEDSDQAKDTPTELEASDSAVEDETVTPADKPAPPETGFANLGLKPELVDALTGLGYEEPTPIQRQAIPMLLEGLDIVGQAATGTGKTAAFALPILNNISKNDAAMPVALIVVPTRELAVQVSDAFTKYGKQSRVKVLPIFGGDPMFKQLKALSRGVHVVVATPGRAIDHIKRGSLDLTAIQTVVLDEADEMLDMGFTEDIEAILDATPSARQTVLFSATMPPRIAKIAKTYQSDPVTVAIGASKEDKANPLIRQTVYMVLRSHKASALGRILDVESPKSTIVFCRTRNEVDELTVTMNGRGYRAEALHGGMDQQQRNRVMNRLRDGTAELLIATDVAARGLDVDSLTHVVNYDVPTAPESYVHRIGRVGRAGREGVAITIAEPKQRRLLRNIEYLTKQKFTIAKVPSVADLRAKQIDVTIGLVRDALAIDDLEDFRPVLDALGDEFTERQIALAAIKLVHRARGSAGDEREIPDASDSGRSGKYDKGGKGKSGKWDKGGKGKSGKWDKGGKGGKFDKKGRNDGPKFSGDKGYLFVSLGKKVGVRPGDIVGAVANEAGLSGNDIGPIKIFENHAVVGVPKSQVDDVVRSMKQTSIRGKKAKVRRYTD